MSARRPSSSRMRRAGFAAASAGLLVVDAAIRLAAGGPYAGATVLLLAACGVALLPLLPRELTTVSLRVAVLPALALASYSILLTTVSIAGIRLTEVSIRVSVLVLVVGLAAVSLAFPEQAEEGRRSSSSRREVLALAALVAIFAFAFASSWDIVDPFPPRGTDWGHYLQYADEVAVQERLLIDDPLAGEADRVFADPPAVGAVFGSFRILDGISSWSLGFGVIVASALTVLSVYAAVAGLWGIEAGLIGAAAYAVAPIRLEPMYWYGLGTTAALVFVPLVVLALGLLYRGSRDARVVSLLALALLGVAVSHSTSAIVVGLLVALVALVDLVVYVLEDSRAPGRALRAWWKEGTIRPVALALALAAVVGAGVVAHLRLQKADLGAPVSYRFFEPDWLDLDTVVEYYSWPFLLLAAASLALVLSRRRLRRDPALLAVGSLALATVVVSQLWRIHVPFEYRRSVFYLGIVMVVVIGVGAVGVGRRALWIGAYVVALAYIAHVSVGLRLPERLLSGPEQHSQAVAGLETLRAELDSGRRPDTSLVVADRCLHFVVPYLLRRPTIAAFEEWQVGFANRVPLARTAAAVIRGGPEGRRLARRLDVGYVVADPRCTPNPSPGLGAKVAIRNDELVVLQLPSAA